ncbi:hypothetical protein U1Q18_014605 [Sarracenia purpurea var. burkii]
MKFVDCCIKSGSEDEEDVDGDEEEDGLRDKTISGSDSGYEATGAHSLTNLNQVLFCNLSVGSHNEKELQPGVILKLCVLQPGFASR